SVKNNHVADSLCCEVSTDGPSNFGRQVISKQSSGDDVGSAAQARAEMLANLTRSSAATGRPCSSYTWASTLASAGDGRVACTHREEPMGPNTLTRPILTGTHNESAAAMPSVRPATCRQPSNRTGWNA